MNRLLAALLAVFLASSAGLSPVVAAGATQADADADCSFPVTQTDATGTEVAVESEPKRIVTLSPSAAQTMWEIGGREKVVGLTQYASYLAGADSRTNVSGAGQSFVSSERVVSLSPDLVLAPNTIPNATVEKLRDAGLTVFKFEAAATIDAVYEKTELTGRLTGECAGAAETVAWMRDRVGTVREAVENADSPSVLVSQGAGWTAGNDTFIHELVTTAGGENVAASAGVSGYAKLSAETVVAQNPEWIVQVGQFGVYPQTDAYNSTTAVREGQVFTVNENYLSQPAPRIVSPLATMAERFHPEAYAAANATTAATATTTATTTPTAADAEATTTAAATTADATASEAAMAGDEGTATPTAEGGQGTVPGFGVPAALAGLAALGATRVRS